jgi:hypothetical protein
VSSQQDEPAAGKDAVRPTAAGQPPEKTPWKRRGDGKTVFRREAPFIFFWLWIAFVIFNVVQVVIPDHNYFSIELSVGLIGLTGLAYACGFRPRVIADEESILVHNPVRDHQVLWGALTGVSLGESVELHCARPAPKKDKTVYCWALYANRKARRRNHGGTLFGSMRTQLSGNSRLPPEARELERTEPVELMAAELGNRLGEARERGVPAAVLESRTAWVPIASFCVPAAALLGLLLAR